LNLLNIDRVEDRKGEKKPDGMAHARHDAVRLLSARGALPLPAAA